MEFVVTKLNYTAYELDRLYNINSGGCCYFAYRIAYWLEKYGIEYYFIIQDDGPIQDYIGKHYCLQVLPSKLYLNKSPLYTHIKSIKRTSNQILDYYKKSSWSEKYDALNNSVQENIKGIRVVKSYVREKYEKEKFDRAAEDVCGDFTRAEKILAFNNPLMQFCLYVVMIFVLSFGSYTIITSGGLDLDVGQFSALLVYSFQILNSLMMFSMVFVMVTMAAESAQRIVEVLKEDSTLTSPADPVEAVEDGSIDFDHVSFKYSLQAEKMALADIDLHIRSGETIGIIGGTGSSKSSLIQLISRLYDATEGVVKVGGKDVREYDLEALRNQVAVVLQKNILFSGTIKENLRWGNQNATDEELKEACRLAQADEFIMQFPDQYDTHIEQGGSNVSGGQKQRLCIARALLKKPKILILDDSTSAVDTRTDAQIRKALREYIPETTKIIIAQRISSVQDADRILVMDGGTICNIGTHEELLKTSEIYREVYTSQNKGGDSDEK